MIIVLDASAAMEIVLNRPRASCFIELIAKAKKTISSDLFKAEVANVIWKYVKAGLLPKERASRTLELAENLVDEFIDIALNNEEAMNESIRCGHSTYDMLYFTLARRYSSTLMTLDAKLSMLAEKNGLDVVS